MGTLNQNIRQLINDYYACSETMSLGMFCQSRKIKVYYMKRLLELYGQKLAPGLQEMAHQSRAIDECELEGSLVELWRESSQFIAFEVSDQEKERLKGPSAGYIEFERKRFRLLIDIAMMPYSIKGLETIRLLQRRLMHDFL